MSSFLAVPAKGSFAVPSRPDPDDYHHPLDIVAKVPCVSVAATAGPTLAISQGSGCAEVSLPQKSINQRRVFVDVRLEVVAADISYDIDSTVTANGQTNC
jgi:hypothetical protein